MCTPTLDLDSFFKDAEVNPDCSYHEISQYGSLFFHRPPTLAVSGALDRLGGGAVYYEYIGAFLCQYYSTPFTKSSFERFVALIDISQDADCMQ